MKINVRKSYIGRICLRSQNFPNHFISLHHRRAKIRTSGPRYFKLVQALAGNRYQPAVSFQSQDKPNHYLRHRGWFIYADNPRWKKRLFREDATFFVHKSQWFPGYYSFESLNYPGHYIRHQNYRLRISKYHRSRLFERDASFKIENC